MNLSGRLGKYQYLRGKSAFYIEAIRSWVMPGSAAGAFAKYLGFSSSFSLVVAVGVPLVVEALGFLLGRFLWERGGVQVEYQMALDTDPYKVRSLALLEDIREELRRERGARVPADLEEP